MNTSLLLVVVVALLIVGSLAQPLGRSKTKATHVKAAEEKPGFDWKKLFVIPNTYYDIPKHRYPYYDENGVGRTLYGYGGQNLYKYSVFKPLEGYFKK